MKKTLHAFAALAAILLPACSVPAGWSVDGAIDGAPQGTRLALEAYNNGRWYLIDSLSVENQGAFGYDSKTPAHYPEIMRLSLPGKGSIYFPVDSVDNVFIETTIESFGRGYRLSGTPIAAKIGSVDSIINESIDRIGTDGAVTDENLRRRLVTEITGDTTGIVAYYVVSKSVGNKLIFDPSDEFGNRVYGAAAQVFANYRPEDPRGNALKAVYFNGRRALGKITVPDSTITVPETGVIDIVRYDYNGKKHSLAEEAAKGNVVVLSFSAYDLPQSPAYNAILADIYNKYHDKGLEIYQLAFDDDEVAWKAAAKNLPWTTVWNSPADGIQVLASYNVGALPLTYVIDRNGSLAARVIDPVEIEKEVKKHF